MRALKKYIWLSLIACLPLCAMAQDQKDAGPVQAVDGSTTDESSGSGSGELIGFGRRAKSGEHPPKALLIELFTRARQRKYLKEMRPELLPVFEHDVTEVNKRTVMDWSKYFKFCPVYFFIDTMADKVARGEFEGVLLDANMQVVANPSVGPGERNIYIGYYGTPIPQPDSVRPTGPLGQYMEHDGDDATSLIRERLLINDADFRLLPENKPRTNYIRAVRPAGMGTREYRRYKRALTYNASRWYIDYLPVAYSYDATLRRYFRVK